MWQDIRRKSPILTYLICLCRRRWGDLIAEIFNIRKLEYPCHRQRLFCMAIYLAVLTELRLVTDRQMDGPGHGIYTVG